MAGRFARAQLMESMNHHPSRWHFEHHSSATVDCDGHHICTIVTSFPFVVCEWLFRMLRHHTHHLRRSNLLVGMGVQWTPPYFTGYQSPPATIQLCIGVHCLIVQLSHAPCVPAWLRRFLSHPSITFVGVNNHRDNDQLMNYSRNDELNLRIPNLIDLVDVAAVRRGCPRVISMEDLANMELQIQVRKDPDIGRRCWDGYDLNDEQVKYACVDAYVSFLLGMSLDAVSWNENRFASESDSQSEDDYY